MGLLGRGWNSEQLTTNNEQYCVLLINFFTLKYIKLQKKSWDEFRKTGLFLFINSILHAFGWAIVIKMDDDCKVVEVFPARVFYRGFPENDVEESHSQIAKYLKENGDALNKEVNEIFETE